MVIRALQSIWRIYPLKPACTIHAGFSVPFLKEYDMEQSINKARMGLCVMMTPQGGAVD